MASRGEGMKTMRQALGLLAGLLLIAGCRQDMHNQPKLVPQRGTSFFADQSGARTQVAGTVARGQLREESFFYSGVVAGANGYRDEVDALPMAVTPQLLERGRERFNVFCSPCHSRVGNGLGQIVMRGYKPAANLQDQVRRAQPVSHYFYVITNGYGAMPDHAAQVAPIDRWAVAAYIRALQLSQSAALVDVPSGVRVDSLKTIAARSGHPEFAEPWKLPETAVQAKPGEAATPALAPAGAAPPSMAPQPVAPQIVAKDKSKKKTTAAPAGAGK